MGTSCWVVQSTCIVKGAVVDVQNLLIHPGATLILINSKVTVKGIAVGLGNLSCTSSMFIAKEAYREFTGTLGELRELLGLSLEELWDLDAAITRSARASGIVPLF